MRKTFGRWKRVWRGEEHDRVIAEWVARRVVEGRTGASLIIGGNPYNIFLEPGGKVYVYKLEQSRGQAKML